MLEIRPRALAQATIWDLLPDAMAEPLAIKVGPDPGAVVGHAEDDRASPGGVGHAGHLACQVASRRFVAIASRHDPPAWAPAAGFFLHIDLTALDLVRSCSGRQACEEILNLGLQL